VSLFAGEERRQTRIGAVVVLAVLAAIAFVVLLADRVEVTRQVRFEVVFAHSGSLHVGAPVVVAGDRIGEVEALRPVARGESGALGGEPGVAARVRIDAEAAWKVDAAGEFFVSSRGALSERFLEVGPQPCARREATRPRECTGAAGEVAPPRPIRAGDQVRGVDPPSMDRVLQRTWANLQTTRRFVEAVRPELELLLTNIATLRATIDGVQPMPGAWARLFTEGAGLYAAIGDTRALLGGDAGLDHLRGTIAAGRELASYARARLAELDARWQGLAAGLDAVSARLSTQGGAASARLGDAITSARAALAKLEPLRAKLAAIRDRLDRGEGSIGKLMKDPEFPEDAKDLGRIMKRQPWRIIGHPPDDLDQGAVAP
jgi:hypothetical protein